MTGKEDWLGGFQSSEQKREWGINQGSHKENEKEGTDAINYV